MGVGVDRSRRDFSYVSFLRDKLTNPAVCFLSCRRQDRQCSIDEFRFAVRT